MDKIKKESKSRGDHEAMAEATWGQRGKGIEKSRESWTEDTRHAHTPAADPPDGISEASMGETSV